MSTLGKHPQTIGLSISYSGEIDKVRTENQRKIYDLRDFYDMELSKMREEFQNREVRIKERMDK